MDINEFKRAAGLFVVLFANANLDTEPLRAVERKPIVNVMRTPYSLKSRNAGGRTIQFVQGAVIVLRYPRDERLIPRLHGYSRLSE